jgi:hypothetical protein
MTTETKKGRCTCCGEKLSLETDQGQCPGCAAGQHKTWCTAKPTEAKPSQQPAPVKEPATAEEQNGRPTVEVEKAVALVPLDASELPATRTEVQALSRGLEFRSLDEIWRFTGFVVASGLAPKGLANREAAFLAVEMGLELGMPPMMALQNIGVINGKPAPYGHAVKGMVEASGKLEEFSETFEGEFPKDDFKAVVISKRAGRDPLRTEFSIADAKRAKLWEKRGASGQDTPWITHPKRMLMWRARQFNLHDNFPDVTRGFRTFEELQDEPAIETTAIPMPSRRSETKPEAAT